MRRGISKTLCCQQEMDQLVNNGPITWNKIL